MDFASPNIDPFENHDVVRKEILGYVDQQVFTVGWIKIVGGPVVVVISV